MPSKPDPNRKRRATPSEMKKHRAWVAEQAALGATLNMRIIMEARGVAATTAVTLMNEVGYVPSRAWHRLSNLNTDTQTADCVKCGSVKVYYRRHRDEWICSRHRLNRTRGRQRQPHGLTVNEAKELRQGRTCEFRRCTSPAEAVDHCHDSLNIRGVLCTRHNHLLGNAQDSLEDLEDAADYLKMTTGVDGLARLGYAG